MKTMSWKTDAPIFVGSGAAARWPRLSALAAAMLVVTGCLTAACTGPKTPAAPNVPPTASFVFSPVSPIVAGRTAVTFDATGSQDTDGNIVSYVWNFGDGSATSTLTTPVVIHAFPDTRITCDQVVYAVQLTVVDNQGARTTTSNEVTVTELPDPRTVTCTPGTSG
jgi:PKD domain